jgi:mono/diheme cytochrome c family protein
MKQQEREAYLEKYDEQKKKGVPFWPDIIFKDVVVSLVIFVILFALASYYGASLEEIADPSDDSYTPRPEWYFLFLFQLLKYFPGDLEVIGVIVLPVLAITFLILLPYTDRTRWRHWSARPVVSTITIAMLAGATFLTAQSLLESAPPGSVTEAGDRTAALYVSNCAGCHGSKVEVSPDADLFAVISAGTHEGMPPWNADLSADEIDALIGFILAPRGSEVFAGSCSQCHAAEQLIEADAIELRNALESGSSYEPHVEFNLAEWSDTLTSAEQGQLLNFLTAPDGQRLWDQQCASCHGRSVAFDGSESELRGVVVEGGGHLDMPAFGSTLSEADIQTLARYVLDPTSPGADIFAANCSTCHAQTVPTAASLPDAVDAIARGGAHENMPVWGEILTDEQVSALVTYVNEAAEGGDLASGGELFAQNCSSCHGDLGEGGVNPARAGDIIAPISTAEYLRTRDDRTLEAIISQGQPNFGMSPFGDTFGGPLKDDQVDAIVAFMRAWEENPPVELPPDTPSTPQPTASGREVYGELCAQCHGASGEGGIGIAFADTGWQDGNQDSTIFDAINLGHEATAMIAWGELLSLAQIEELVAHIRTLDPSAPTTTAPGGGAAPTFDADVLPIFDASCAGCHGTLGGWTGTSYTDAITTGANGPTIVPGSPDTSRLVQSLIGTHPTGMVMPPGGSLSDADIQTIIDWVAGGALEK